MNILISYNWLKDYVKIKDSPEELARKISLCGPSVERVIKKKIDSKNDYIFDTEITTNRPDMLSILGFAREVSAITGGKLLKEYRRGNPPNSPYKGGNKNINLQVQVEDKKNCPRYLAIVLDNIKVESSPWWMQKRLLSYGIRPINNIVDITNYVMLEQGQPMHAFDYDKLENSKLKTQNFGKTIVIRKAKNKEKIITLDNEIKELNSEMLVIADAKEPIAIAGIKGGKKAEIDSKTKRIILEAANFNEVLIRKTSRALNLYSDSSVRFEKSLSDQLPLPAMKRAIELIQTLTGARIASPLIDKRTKKYQPTKIKLTKKKIESFLGVKISDQKIVKILNSLGFKTATAAKKYFIVNVPFWRDKDVQIEVDLIEEIARIYGYYKLPAKLPLWEMSQEMPQKEKKDDFYWENKIKEILSGIGFTEIYSYSFISKDLLKKCGFKPKKCLNLLNPLNVDLEYMRPSLVPSMLQIIFQNQKIKDEFEIFEMANVYLSKESNKLPDERINLCGAIVQKEKNQQLFYRVKGVIELLFEKIGIDVLTVSYKPLAISQFWHLIKSAEVSIKNVPLGVIGEINPEILAKFDIDMSVAMFDFDFPKLIKKATTKRTYQPIIKFPSVKLDLAIVINKKIPWNDIQNLIYQTNKNFIKKVEVFDIYEGQGIPKDKKSLAFHIIYQADNRTLKNKEVNKMQEKIVKVLEGKFKAQVRN